MPLDLDRVNWGAFFFGWLWAGAYGAWPWFALLFVYWVTSRQILFLAADSSDRVLTTTVAIVTAVGTWALPAMLALRANRTLWRYERDRRAGTFRPAVGRPSPVVSQYLASQRVPNPL